MFDRKKKILCSHCEREIGQSGDIEMAVKDGDEEEKGKKKKKNKEEEEEEQKGMELKTFLIC